MCAPAGKKVTYRFTNEEAGKTLRSYWTNDCESCVIRHRCTTSKQRRVRRWEYEDILERVQKRLDGRWSQPHVYFVFSAAELFVGLPSKGSPFLNALFV
jgi:hypothetical protein